MCSRFFVCVCVFCIYVWGRQSVFPKMWFVSAWLKWICHKTVSGRIVGGRIVGCGIQKDILMHRHHLVSSTALFMCKWEWHVDTLCVGIHIFQHVCSLETGSDAKSQEWSDGGWFRGTGCYIRGTHRCSMAYVCWQAYTNAYAHTHKHILFFFRVPGFREGGFLCVLASI